MTYRTYERRLAATHSPTLAQLAALAGCSWQTVAGHAGRLAESGELGGGYPAAGSAGWMSETVVEPEDVAALLWALPGG